ncbi:MAG: LysR family transcriptional regulator [Rhodopseudomonas sp.]|nr:LysR family transcriptional regulator [Rhodopseudomonas sp.]
MKRDNLDDLAAFLAVARERSFTKAAAKLGVSQSALSQTVSNLEARLAVRLLTRTTRSVATTEAGERLARTLAPRLDDIDAELKALAALREKPAGTIRITADEHAANMVLWPALAKFLPSYPDIKVEIMVDFGLTDIVAEGYDAGVRTVEIIAKDMIAVPIAPKMRMAVVGSPAYFKGRPRPERPQDLTAHRCINLRLPTHGGLYAWEFERKGRELRVRVDGQLVFNSLALLLKGALAGLGLCYVPEIEVKDHVKSGRLVRVLDDWCEPFAGYHLYFPSRRQQTPAFSLLVDALRYRG